MPGVASVSHREELTITVTALGAIPIALKAMLAGSRERMPWGGAEFRGRSQRSA